MLNLRFCLGSKNMDGYILINQAIGPIKITLSALVMHIKRYKSKLFFAESIL